MEVFTDAFGKVVMEREARVLRFTRNSTPYPTEADLEHSFAATNLALDGVGRKGYALLVDLRAARGSQSPGFEAAMARVRPRLMSGFDRVAILVQSAVGALQLQRHAREDGRSLRDLRVFVNDEPSALAFVRSRGSHGSRGAL